MLCFTGEKTTQVIYGVFVLFCPIGEAVSQTIQTYLPGFTVKRPPRANGKPRKSRTFGRSAVKMVQMISAVALGLGVLNAGVATLLTAGLPSLFTPDRAVWAAMRAVSPLCGLSLVLHGVTMGLQVGLSCVCMCVRARVWREGGGVFLFVSSDNCAS